MARVVLADEAERDLVEIATYIAERSGSWQTADRLLGRIDQACGLLATQPESGQRRLEFATGRYRSFTVGNYVIYFEHIQDGIRVARVLHAARDHGPLL
jgi:toxin ParE1/3/4